MNIVELVKGLNELDVQCFQRKTGKGTTTVYRNPETGQRCFISRRPVVGQDGIAKWTWMPGEACQNQGAPVAQPAPAQPVVS